MKHLVTALLVVTAAVFSAPTLRSQNILPSQLLLLARPNSIIPLTVDHGAGPPYSLVVDGRNTNLLFGPSNPGGFAQYAPPAGGMAPGGGFNPSIFQQALPTQPPGILFQPGITPGAFLQVPAGGTRTLAAYCGDLGAQAPNAGVRLLADPNVGEVRLANYTMPIRDAQTQGLIFVRGHDDWLDGMRTDGGGWLDLQVVNRSPYDMDIRIDPGTVLTPMGQARPEVDSQVVSLLQQEARAGMDGTAEACMTMWASRGSSSQDVAEENFRFLPRRTLAAVQSLLDQSGIHRAFQSGDSDYRAQYLKTLAAFGPKPEIVRLRLELRDGAPADAILSRNTSGDGVLDITPHQATGVTPTQSHLYYAASILDDMTGGFSLTVLHPKTCQPLPGIEPLLFGKPR